MPLRIEGKRGPRLLRALTWLAAALVAAEAALVIAGGTVDSRGNEVLADRSSPPMVVEGAEPATATAPWVTDPARFEDFPVAAIFSGPPAPVDLASHPGARRFRTRLREGAAGGPNFAGHYTVVTWGCGTECLMLAIVDARDGRVFFPGIVGELGFDFRIGSNLIIENPAAVYEACGAVRTTAESRQRFRDGMGGPNAWLWVEPELILLASPDG